MPFILVNSPNFPAVNLCFSVITVALPSAKGHDEDGGDDGLVPRDDVSKTWGVAERRVSKGTEVDGSVPRTRSTIKRSTRSGTRAGTLGE